MSQALTLTHSTIPMPTRVDHLTDIIHGLNASELSIQVKWTRGLNFKEMESLWGLCRDTHISSDDFVHDDASVVICEGKNGLPVLTQFQKRFARLGDQIVGYNHNNWLQAWLGGPGHFVVHDSPSVEGEVWINYLMTPRQKHPDYPKLLSNNVLLHPRGLFARWVYGGMVDVIRRVSDHVVIGYSIRPDNSPGPNEGMYFTLVLPQR
jgi:hypothetical protein